MALDSRQKRAAVIGVGRPWYRNPDPNSLDAAQRPSIGSVYPVATFALPAVAEELVCNELALINDRAVSLDAAIDSGVTNLAADIEELTNLLGIISDRVNNIDAEIDDSVTNLDAPLEC